MKPMISLILILFPCFFFITNGYPASCITDAAGTGDSLKVFGNKTSAAIWADVKPPEGATITRVRAEIYAPIWVPDTPVVELVKIGDSLWRYEGVYTGFTQNGEYIIEYDAEDSQGACKETTTGVVIKVPEDEYEPDDAADKARQVQINGNNPQQRNFHKDGDTDWVKFLGAAGEHYTITVNNTHDLTNTVIELYDADGTTLLKQSEKNDAFAGKELSLEWDCPMLDIYFLKLKNHQAVNFGENITYELTVQRKIAANEGTLTGTVKNGISNKPLRNVKLWTTGNGSDLSSDDGTYKIKESPCLNCILTAKITGYETFQQIVNIQEAQILPIDIFLFPGDITGDSMIDISDLILSLRIIAGQDERLQIQGDVNEDNRIGWEDVFYILRKIGGY